MFCWFMWSYLDRRIFAIKFDFDNIWSEITKHFENDLTEKFVKSSISEGPSCSHVSGPSIIVDFL